MHNNGLIRQSGQPKIAGCWTWSTLSIYYVQDAQYICMYNYKQL